MNLPEEALEAAVAAELAHDDTFTADAIVCDCGNRYVGNDEEKVRQLQHHRMQVIADVLRPFILDQIVQERGRQEWRVTGDPGAVYGPYNFVWPRRGSNENGEEQARAFIAQFTKPGRLPWPDGPHLHHRTVYTHETDWEEAT